MFCRQCGNPIEDGNRFCMYCGKEVYNGSIVFHNENQMKNTNNAVLVSQLSALASNIDSLEKLVAEMESVNTQLQIPVTKTTVSRGQKMKPFIVGGIILILVGSFYSIGLVNEIFSRHSSVSDIIGFLISMLLFEGSGAGLIACGIATSGRRATSANKEYEEQYNKELINRENLQNRLNSLNDEKMTIVDAIKTCMFFDGSVIRIPDEYFYSNAIEFFADRISAGRADTLKEAIDQYELHLHRLKLEDAAYAAAEYQRLSAINLAAIRRASAMNAAANVANTINHWND